MRRSRWRFQEALALLIESGRFDRHLRRVRDLYRARRDILVREVTTLFGPGRLLGHNRHNERSDNRRGRQERLHPYLLC